MKKIELMEHQKRALQHVGDRSRVAFYLDMGLGKTFVASEKAKQAKDKAILIICQKSKINDWKEHYQTYYGKNVIVYKNQLVSDIPSHSVIIVNYETAWRRPELKKLKNFTLILDESQYIKNEKANRSKFILSLSPNTVILLSGTPTGGKYEELYSQCKLLGWKINKKEYWNNFIRTKALKMNGFRVEKVIGYKNVDRLKRKLREYGAVFMKSEDVLTLPMQNDIPLTVKNTKDYAEFQKHSIIEKKDLLIVGDTTLNKMLGLRQLCSIHNKNKLEVVQDLLESSNERFIIFYNFQMECDALEKMCKRLSKPVSIVNGKIHSLDNYEQQEDSVTLIQYVAGASGLNLQKANKIIYFTPTFSSELFEQSKKRIHRIGQEKPCFYYYPTVEGSIEENIYSVLAKRQDYTQQLFEG